MGDRPNILQIENLLDLVEYALKDSSEIESMVWDSWSPMNIPINDSFLESSDDFLQQFQIINYRTKITKVESFKNCVD